MYATQFPCALGTYSDATDLVKLSSCSQCPERYSCSAGATSATLHDCPAGYYCPIGTGYGNEMRCPPGTYSNRTLLKDDSECTPCPPGFYCVGGQKAISGPCTAGYFCPSRTSNPTAYPCPAGTYSSSTNIYEAAQCINCPAGYYCLVESTKPSLCPAGTYSSQTNTVSPGPGIFPSCTTCPAGYKCPAGSSNPIQCGLGYYSGNNAANCTVCPRGHYCGSLTTTYAAMSTGGASWHNAGDTAGICFNGTYCSLGLTHAPDLLRNSCPAGFYCPSGIAYPLPCPSGTYSSSAGQDNINDCVTTPAGFYSIQNSTSVNGMCAPGYYCPAGSSGPQEVACPARYYRPEFGGGSVSDCSLCVAGGYCPQGTYNPNYGGKSLSDCLQCPVGYYCGGIGNVNVTGKCYAGYYCTGGASQPTQYQSTPGHFSVTGSSAMSTCLPGFYNGGYYCAYSGQSAVSGPCSKGYYCSSGATVKTPVDGVTGNVCPIGHYCPVGTGTPIGCPRGTFMNNTLNAGNITFKGVQYPCDLCLTGYACDGVGLVRPTSKCGAGYFCKLGAPSAGPSCTSPTCASMYGICPVGHYCPPGTT
eukprot:gene118-117_t